MTFRDDHDAALARADALEEEVERTKRERDELAAKVKELEAASKQPPPKPPKPKKPKKRAASESSSSESDSGDKATAIFAVAITVLGVGIFGGISMCQSCDYKKEHAAWVVKSEARKAYIARWQGLVSLEPCVRRVAWGTMTVKTQDPSTIDPRVNSRWYPAGNASTACYSDAAKLLGDPRSSPGLKTALGQWIDLQHELDRAAKPIDDYYSNRDYVEDNLAAAPKLWAPVKPLLDRQAVVTEALRRELPPLREEIRAAIKAHEASKGRDELYWRGALTVALFEINDQSYAAAGIYAGKPPDQAAAVAVIKQPVAQFLELVKQAPIEIRREFRNRDWITSQIVPGAELIGSDPLMRLADDEGFLLNRNRDQIPALPPDPGREPEEPGGD